jgi:hypothetical protein
MAGVTRVGATKQYSDNWDNVFGGGKGRSSGPKSAQKPARKSPKKSAPSAKKKAGKKAAGGAKRKGRSSR